MNVLDKPRDTTRLAPATPEAEAVRLQVLDACRSLFNEQSLSTVTIARIADTLGMNEGRLHYYFNTKQQIVVALFDLFQTAVTQAASRGLTATDRAATDSTATDRADRYADYQENWFMLMWRYRFVYRDWRALIRIAPSLEKRLTRIYAEGQTQLRHVLDDMVTLNLLTATPTQRDHLTINAWVISTYWIDYLTTLHATTSITHADLEAGMRQIDSLFAPYVTEAGKQTRKGQIHRLD